jgi:hypothetical protein
MNVSEEGGVIQSIGEAASAFLADGSIDGDSRGSERCLPARTKRGERSNAEP